MKEIGSLSVGSIMTHHGATCSPRQTAEHAAQKMLEHDCGALPIIEKSRIVGILTDRDICCRVVANKRSADTTLVAEIMTSPVVTITPQNTVEECCRLMVERRVRRLPVIDRDGICCGIVSLGDIGDRAPGYADWVFEEISRRHPAHDSEELLLE